MILDLRKHIPEFRKELDLKIEERNVLCEKMAKLKMEISQLKFNRTKYNNRIIKHKKSEILETEYMIIKLNNEIRGD